jgi:putative transposase
MQCRFVPNGSNYIMEIVYEIEVPEQPTESKSIASIDLGIDNFATITNNIGLQPIAIKGNVIKSYNQYYNKYKAEIQSELMLKNGKHWSNKLDQFTTKRNNKIKDWMHKASKFIVNWCIHNSVDTLVCGYNKEWKQESDIGKKNNQKFVAIPYFLFVNQLEYKCQNVGINFITTEESYTSGTDFLGGEIPCKQNYDKSRRITRGLFKSVDKIVNADVNGSYQIMMKVFPNAFNVNGVEGVGCHPLSMKIA